MIITVVIIIIIKTRNDKIMTQDRQNYVRSDWVYRVITTAFSYLQPTKRNIFVIKLIIQRKSIKKKNIKNLVEH